MKTLCVIVMVILWTAGDVFGQPDILKRKALNAYTKVEPPAIFENRISLGKTSTATFQVTFSQNFPQNARSAVSYAADIWSYLLNSPHAITINAVWEDMDDTTLLAEARPDSLFKDFPNAPFQNIWYPVALAEMLSEQNLNGIGVEIQVTFNSEIDWYYGTDGNPPGGKSDLVSVALHEMAHGLGFYDSFSFSESTGEGSWGAIQYYAPGFATVYDSSCISGQNHNITLYRLTNISTYPNPSIALGDQLIGDNVYFDGVYTYWVYNDSLPKLSAPTSWAGGSSIAHLDESAFPEGNSNSLMSVSLADAECNASVENGHCDG